MTSDVSPCPPTPRGLPGLLMAVASRLDAGDTPPSLQRTQTLILIALAVQTFYPMLPL
jgi:hypothetical protein